MLKVLAISIILVAFLALLAVYAVIWFAAWQAGVVFTAVLAMCFGIQWATEYLSDAN